MLNRLLFGLLASGICHASPILEINRNLPRAEAQPEALEPRARSDRRRDDWEDLVPKTAHELYFASGGPTVEHKYADMAANFTGRAVVLEKSDFVKDVKCSAHAIDVVFSEQKVYDYVRQHCFWDVTALTFEKDLTVRAAVNEEKGMDVVIDSVSLSWGTWVPERPPLKGTVSKNKRKRQPRPNFHVYPDTSSLQRRGSLDWAKRKLSQAYNAGKAAGQSAINSVGNGIKAGVQFVGQVAADILAYKPTVSESFPIEVRPGKDKYDTSAPWENSLEIWKGKKASSNGAAEAELAIYCVDCHLTGVVKLQGAAEFNIKDGLKVLYAQTDGDFTAQVALGIKASAKYEQDCEKEVLTYPIPGAGFVVKGIITIGAFVEARAKAQLEVELAGDLLAGIKMTECKWNAKIDFVKVENCQRPTLSPKFEPFFKANAQVSAKAGVSFPVAVGVGIKVPLLKFDGTVSIVEQPGINAEAEWKGSIGQGPSEGTDDGKKEGTNDGTKEGANDGTTESDLTSNTPVPEARSLFMREEEECKGIKWGVKFVNEIYLDAFKRYKHSLHKFEAPIAGSCFVPGSSSTTDSSGGTAIQKIAARAQGQVTDDWDAKEFDFVNDFADDWDAQDYADNDRMEAEALQEAEKSEQSGEYPDGTEFITIKDASQKFQLVSDDKGLLRPASSTNPLAAGNMFAEDEGLVYGDYTGRSFRHTSAIMRFTGVADISLGKKDAEPSDADSITFVPTRIAAGKYAYVAMTMDGKAYAVMTCNYQNAPSRVWLMKSQTWGEKILKIAPAFLTGGKITKCVNMLWSVDGSDVESW